MEQYRPTPSSDVTFNSVHCAFVKTVNVTAGSIRHVPLFPNHHLQTKSSTLPAADTVMRPWCMRSILLEMFSSSNTWREFWKPAIQEVAQVSGKSQVMYFLVNTIPITKFFNKAKLCCLTDK